MESNSVEGLEAEFTVGIPISGGAHARCLINKTSANKQKKISIEVFLNLGVVTDINVVLKIKNSSAFYHFGKHIFIYIIIDKM